ncbi:substrate-binding domain-containing protein [Oryzifoliimicrobium ureilyticus]|uniref:substrate-binding domain-containing protein n=1 Tax=Oryzifoliimicrobium ureilyticus TaxID=3113724 RepID=UPI0030762202
MKKFFLATLWPVLMAFDVQAQTIGLSMSDLDNFRTTLQEGVVAKAQATPGVKLVVQTAGGKNDVQMQQIKQMIADKVDAIIVGISDGDLGPQISKMASDANIPLVYVNNVPSNLADLPDNQAVSASDELESGTLQTKEICSMLKGKGKVVVLIGEPFHAAARARTEDVDRVLATPECSGVQIVERQAAFWSRDLADQQVQEWISAGVKFDAVIANNDDMALGAIRAMKRNGVSTSKVLVAGIDAIGDALTAMQAGDLAVTIRQNGRGQGAVAVDAALKMIKSEKVPRENNVPFELVTRKNLVNYLPKSQ